MKFYQQRETAVLASISERIKSRLSSLAERKQVLIEAKIQEIEAGQLENVRKKLGQKQA